MAEAQAQPDGEAGSVRGVLDHVTYQNDDTGFTIARLVPEGGGSPITVVGTLSALNLGETLEVRGNWTVHPKYGRQLKIEEYHTIVPSSAEGIPSVKCRASSSWRL